MESTAFLHDESNGSLHILQSPVGETKSNSSNFKKKNNPVGKGTRSHLQQKKAGIQKRATELSNAL
jgi:hypothetical protein